MECGEDPTLNNQEYYISEYLYNETDAISKYISYDTEIKTEKIDDNDSYSEFIFEENEPTTNLMSDFEETHSLPNNQIRNVETTEKNFESPVINIQSEDNSISELENETTTDNNIKKETEYTSTDYLSEEKTDFNLFTDSFSEENALTNILNPDFEQTHSVSNHNFRKEATTVSTSETSAINIQTDNEENSFSKLTTIQISLENEPKTDYNLKSKTEPTSTEYLSEDISDLNFSTDYLNLPTDSVSEENMDLTDNPSEEKIDSNLSTDFFSEEMTDSVETETATLTRHFETTFENLTELPTENKTSQKIETKRTSRDLDLTDTSVSNDRGKQNRNPNFFIVLGVCASAFLVWIVFSSIFLLKLKRDHQRSFRGNYMTIIRTRQETHNQLYRSNITAV